MNRSEFLTYWTGRDILLDPSRLEPASRRAYLERLHDVIRAGLWMTVPGEELVSSAGPDAVKVGLRVPMTCFTELRLSGARPHFTRYGLLGFVVHRKFVLERGGGPVLYVRQHDDDPLVSNVGQLLTWLLAKREEGVVDAADMTHGAFFLCSFLKPMSTANTDDFSFIDEHEWRIVQSDRQVREGKIVRTERPPPPYRIPLSAADLRMLVVPDGELRRILLADRAFAQWCGEASVPILTVTEVENL